MAYNYLNSGSRAMVTSRASLPLSPSDLFTKDNLNSQSQYQQQQQRSNRASLVQNGQSTDVLFYEYEIVDKKKESKFISEQLRKKGYCICSRWIFVVAGNIIILLIIAGLLGLLMYLNTPADPTKAPLSYNEACVSGSTSCNTIANLQCLDGKCACLSNMVYNGTDCICNTSTSYWDGAYCNSLKQYGESCNLTAPCLSYLLCDNTTLTCNCSFGKYYSNGACITQSTYGTLGCTSYMQCQYYLGLTCTGSICKCNTYYYWDGTQCTIQLSWNVACPNNANFASACNTTAGLVACSAQNSGSCQCKSTYYWDGNNCIQKGTYLTSCQATAYSTANNQCDSTYNLICGTGTCNCGPTNAATGQCDCASGQFWDGQKCISKKAATGTCLAAYYCTSNNCLFGFCQ